MSWRVEVQRPAEKELRRVSPEARRRIAQTLRSLENNPFPHGLKKLTGSEGYRIRVGDYRILYTIHESEALVRISAVGHRKDVYR